MNRRGSVTLIIVAALALIGVGAAGTAKLDAARVTQWKLNAKTSKADADAARKFADAQAEQLANSVAMLKRFDDLLKAKDNQLQGAANTLNGARMVAQVSPATDRRDAVVDGYVSATAAGLPAATNDAAAMAEVLRLLSEKDTKIADLENAFKVKSEEAARLSGVADTLGKAHKQDTAVLAASNLALGDLERRAAEAEKDRDKANGFWASAKADALTWFRYAIAAAVLASIGVVLFAWAKWRHNKLARQVGTAIADKQKEAGEAKADEVRAVLDVRVDEADQRIIAATVAKKLSKP